MMKKIFMFIFACLLCVGNTQVTYATDDATQQPNDVPQTTEIESKETAIPESEIVNIPDQKLREVVAKEADKNQDGIITKTEMKELHHINAQGMGIENLEGLQYCGDIYGLYLANNKISDVSVLKDMKFDSEMSNINLSHNLITDINPIADVIKNVYNWVDISNNKITDFSPIYGCDTYHLKIAGNPAADTEYLKLLQLPDDLYLKCGDLKTIAFSYIGFEECLGITFYSDNKDIANIADVNTWLTIIAGKEKGETTVYVQHGDAKHAIRVHVGTSGESEKPDPKPDPKPEIKPETKPNQSTNQDKETKPSQAPQTDDASNVMLYATMLSAATIVGLYVFKKRRV